MGNTETKQRSAQADWEKIDTDNGIQIYRNKFNNEQAEKRIITLDSEYDIEDEIKVYNMRQHNNDALVRTLGTQNLNPNSTSTALCAGQKKIFVFTEKMPHRLSECPQLTFPQSLLFLRESLRAFERIYKEYGSVQVTKELIGLNYLGEVKSWLNQNWALNHRGHEYMNIRSAKVSQLTREQYLSFKGEYMEEPQMIKNIISVIEQKCQDGKFPQAFKQEVENQSGSFKKLLLYLKDFVDYNEIYVPERISYEKLVQGNYRIRLEEQLNFSRQHAQSQSQTTNNGNHIVMSQAQQNQYQSQQNQYQQNQSLYSLGNDYNNGDFIRNMLQTNQNQTVGGYQSSSQIPSQKSIRLNLLPLSETNKASPAASDNLGRVTFSQTNRAYNGQNKLQNSNQKANQSTLTYGANNYQLSNSLEGLYTPSFQQKNGNYGYGSVNDNKATTAESKYEFYTSTGYKPYQPSTYESSFQPVAFESSYQPSKYESSGSKVNGGNVDVHGSKYSYSYSNSFNGSSNLSNQNNLTNYNNQGNLSNYGTSSNYNLPESKYLSNYNLNSSSYQSSFKSITPDTNVVQPYSKSSTYEQRAGGEQLTHLNKVQQEGPKTYQEFKRIAEKAILIDGKSGQRVNNNDILSFQNRPLSGYSGISVVNNITANKWGNSTPSHTTETYNNTITNAQLQQLRQSAHNPSSQTLSSFSFGSKLNNNDSRFGSGYSGTGYSNNLTKYEPSTNLNQNISIHGKYAEAFNSLLSPKIAGIMTEQNTSIIDKINQTESTHVNTTTIHTKQLTQNLTSQQKQTSSNSPSPISSQKAQQQSPNAITKGFDGFSNLVERVSNEVSQSVLKPF